MQRYPVIPPDPYHGMTFTVTYFDDWSRQMLSLDIETTVVENNHPPKQKYNKQPFQAQPTNAKRKG